MSAAGIFFLASFADHLLCVTLSPLKKKRLPFGCRTVVIVYRTVRYNERTRNTVLLSGKYVARNRSVQQEPLLLDLLKAIAF